MTDPTRADAIAIVPTPAVAGGDGSEFELRPDTDLGSETPAGYVATSFVAEIMDVALAIAAIAWKPLRGRGGRSDTT